MSKNIYCLLLLALLAVLIFPEKIKADDVIFIEKPIKEIKVIEIPSKLIEERIPYFLMVTREFPDPIMVDIAMCESGFNPKIKNPGSSASGIFQIIKDTWEDHSCEGDVFDAEDNIACAKKLYEKNGTRDWNPSKSCWGN